MYFSETPHRVSEDDFKLLNTRIKAPNPCMFTVTSVLNTVKMQLLPFQNRSGGCILSHNINASNQSEVITLYGQRQSLSRAGTSISLNTVPHLLTCLGHG